MPLYNVRLESQTDDQWRLRTLEADGPKHAAKLCEQMELNRVSYDLTARQPVKSIQTRRHEDGVHATVNHDLFADSGLGGHDLLAYCEREHVVEADGKAVGPNHRIRNHLAAHYQQEPYKVVKAELFVPSVEQLVAAAKWMQEDPKAWDRVLEQLREEGIPLAAVTGFLYGVPWKAQIEGSATTVWSSNTIKVPLTTSSYSPNQDTDDFFNDVTNEVSGTGYTAGGPTLASKSSSYDTASDQVRLDAGDVSITSSTITARHAVLVNTSPGTSATDPVLGQLDFGADVSTTNGTFAITWDATGIIVYDLT